MKSPTARTLNWLRDHGYAADVVERFIAHAGIRRDLFHCIDIVAAQVGKPILGVQATTLGNLPARLAKARSIPELATWLGADAAFEVFGWCRRNDRWTPRIVAIRAEDLGPVLLSDFPRNRRRSRWDTPESLFAEPAQEATCSPRKETDR